MINIMALEYHDIDERFQCRICEDYQISLSMHYTIYSTETIYDSLLFGRKYDIRFLEPMI